MPRFVGALASVIVVCVLILLIIALIAWPGCPKSKTPSPNTASSPASQPPRQAQAKSETRDSSPEGGGPAPPQTGETAEGSGEEGEGPAVPPASGVDADRPAGTGVPTTADAEGKSGSQTSGGAFAGQTVGGGEAAGGTRAGASQDVPVTPGPSAEEIQQAVAAAGDAAAKARAAAQRGDARQAYQSALAGWQRVRGLAGFDKDAAAAAEELFRLVQRYGKAVESEAKPPLRDDTTPLITR